MDIGTGKYFLGMWTAAKPGLWNWLGSVEKADDGSWNVETRVRLEVDDKVFDSNDPKYWECYKVPAHVPEEDVIKGIEQIRSYKIESLCLFHESVFKEDIRPEVLKETILVQSSDGAAIFEKLQKCEFLNTMAVPIPKGGPSVN